MVVIAKETNINKMPKTLPFHSINEADKLREDRVYHDNDSCPSGRDIPRWERVAGTASYRLCKRCANLR